MTEIQPEDREPTLEEYKHLLAVDIDCEDTTKLIRPLFILLFNARGESLRAMSERMRESRDALTKDLRAGEIYFRILYPIMKLIEAEAKKTTRFSELCPNILATLYMGFGETAEEADKLAAFTIKEMKFDEAKANEKRKNEERKRKLRQSPRIKALKADCGDIVNELKDNDNEKT